MTISLDKASSVWYYTYRIESEKEMTKFKATSKDGRTHIRNSKTKSYTHAVIVTWPDMEEEVAVRFSETLKAALSGLKEFTRRGAKNCYIVEAAPY